MRTSIATSYTDDPSAPFGRPRVPQCSLSWWILRGPKGRLHTEINTEAVIIGVGACQGPTYSHSRTLCGKVDSANRLFFQMILPFLLTACSNGLDASARQGGEDLLA